MWSQADAAMERHAGGDAEAFAIVYDAVAEKVWAYARRKLRDDAAADDVVQETLLRMHRARGDFAPGSEVLPWAYTIAVTASSIACAERASASAIAPRSTLAPAGPRCPAQPSRPGGDGSAHRVGGPVRPAARRLLLVRGDASAGQAASALSPPSRRKLRLHRAPSVCAPSPDRGPARPRPLASQISPPPRPPHRPAPRRAQRPLAFAGAGASLGPVRLAARARTGRPLRWLPTPACGVHGCALLFPRCVARLASRTFSPSIAVLTLVPLAMIGGKLALSVAWPGMTEWWPERPGLRCLCMMLLLGAAPLAASLWAWRHRAVHHPALSGAALGVAAGACAWVLVDLWCAVAHPHHLTLGHLLPLGLLAVSGTVALLTCSRSPRHSTASSW